MSNAIRNVESRISARRALWDAEMEESASHHVAEIENDENFITNGISFEIISGGFVSATQI